ncbi:hypothetical protein CTEN210_17571 [Chaetoceros tenuissimus]|uniref:3'-5' exonuclease domain-containing protein n=1 Tax=Chaetoceros tenuissimus TaxID=426638 RepID=A0AAD3DCZ4_9STRA|nr:hypothetical protein CTEN210_17571 [Chaetoceros tenuissimus]
MTVKVVRSAHDENGVSFLSAVGDICSNASTETRKVAFDCEGVNLCRVGTLEIVSVCFEQEDNTKSIFLLDLGKNEGTPDTSVVRALKDLLENEHVIKIIHDCRMDADALFHHHGISLNNVHDTSCFHMHIAGCEDKNLNHVLVYNGLEANCHREQGIYKRNPSFWSQRPLTKQMIDWASSDVDKLFTLASKQLASSINKDSAIAESKKYARYARDMKVATGLHVRCPGLFIGRRGANLRSLQTRTGTLVYQDGSNGWFVFYHDTSSLDTVKRAMMN